MAGSSDANALMLQFSADISKMQKQVDKVVGIVDSGSKKMEVRAKKAMSEIEGSFTLTNVGKALDSVFDNTRLKVFDSATARFGVTGRALELLGSTGLVAAAGVVAVGAAFAEARGAAKFADDIQDTAARLHTTTDALQEFRYANFQAGGSMEGADQALEAFSGNLGKAQEGLKKGQRAFLALGFTKAQILSFTDADSALKAVTQRIAELKSDPQKDALIDQLGLTGMKPLILEGVGAMEALRQKAHEIGIVMDADIIQRGAEANKQFEVLTKVVDVQLKSAFIDLAPVLVDLLKFAASLAKQIADIADMLRSVENRSSAGLQRQMARNAQSINDNINPSAASRATGTLLFGGAYDSMRAVEIARATKENQQLQAELLARGSPAAPTIPHGTRELIDQGSHPKEKKTPFDHSDDTARKAIAAADQEVLSLTQQITGTIQDHLDTEIVLLGLKQAERNAELDSQVKQGKLSQAQADQIKAAEAKVVSAKENNLQFEAYRKQQDVLDAHQTAMVGFVRDQLDAQSSLANSSAERKVIALELLELDRAEKRKALAKSLQRDPDKTPEQRAAELTGFDRATAAQRTVTSSTNAGPVEAYLRSLQNLDDQFQTFAVDGVKGLSDALATALFDSQNFGASIVNVFKQLFAQILSAEIQKNILGPILSSIGLGIPAHAAGTNFAPGGLSLVGEKGPELVNLPRGSQVFSNPITEKLLSGVRGGQTIIERTIVVRTSETPYFTTKIESAARARATEAGITATRTSMQATPAEMRRRAVQSLG